MIKKKLTRGVEPDFREGGIGLFSYEQIKNTRPVGRFGGMIVGFIWILTGLGVLYLVLSERNTELRNLGSSNLHLGGFFLSIWLIVGGIFYGHVGVIYYTRKLLWWIGLRQNDRRS